MVLKLIFSRVITNKAQTNIRTWLICGIHNYIWVVFFENIKSFSMLDHYFLEAFGVPFMIQKLRNLWTWSIQLKFIIIPDKQCSMDNDILTKTWFCLSELHFTHAYSCSLWNLKEVKLFVSLHKVVFVFHSLYLKGSIFYIKKKEKERERRSHLCHSSYINHNFMLYAVYII